jgi:hypothetical protein
MATGMILAGRRGWAMSKRASTIMGYQEKNLLLMPQK